MSVLKLAPNFAQKSEVLYKLAVIFGKTYQLDHAINYFKLATLESSGAPAMNRRIDILIKMAICYIEKKEYGDALRSSEAALAMNEQNYRALQHVAWCEFLLEKNVQALEHINKAISLKESDGDGYYIKGRILLATEKYPEAGEAFKKAIQHNHSKVTYLGSSGILNALTNSCKEAFDDFLKATQINPSIPEIWFNIGILYEICQQYAEALVAYNKTLEADPTFNEAIVRKQALSSENPIKSPHPQFMHCEFRVYDPMVPMKSFLNNQKVKKAIEPCLNPEFSVQPSNLIKTIFSNISHTPPELPSENVMPGEEIKNSEKLSIRPIEQPKEEVKKEAIEEVKLQSVPKPKQEPSHEKELLPKPEQTKPFNPEPNYLEQPYYMPSTLPMGNSMPNGAPKRPVVQSEIPGAQYTSGTLSGQMPIQQLRNPQPSNPMPTNLPSNNYPSVPDFSLQQMEFLAQFSQFQQSQLQAVLNSLALLPQATNPYMQMMSSFMQPSMPSGKLPFNQSPFGGNVMMNMGRPMQQMGTGDIQAQYNQYPMGMPREPMPSNMPMFNPTQSIHHPDNPPMNYMMGYGGEQAQQTAEVPPKPIETNPPITPTRPAVQHPMPIRPVPRPPIDKSPSRLEDLLKLAASSDDKKVPLQQNKVQEEEKGDSNMKVKLNMPTNKTEETLSAKRKRPEPDVNKEKTNERHIQLRKHKPNKPNN